MAKGREHLTGEAAKNLWEELKKLQQPSRRVTHEELRQIEKKERANEFQQVNEAYRDLVDRLRTKSNSPGSLCILRHEALSPVHASTGIELSRTTGHPCLLTVKYLGKERWLWCTSKRNTVEKVLKKLDLNAKEFLVEIPSKCSEETDISTVDKRRYTVRNLMEFDNLVRESFRAVPSEDSFLGAHWKLFYGRYAIEDRSNLSEYLGIIPDDIFQEVEEKVGVKRDG